MPSSESGGLENFWYSFDQGMVHFVQIDTETDLGHGIIGPDEPEGTDGEDSGPFGLANQQINWLTNDLRTVDRNKTPWVIVGQFFPFNSLSFLFTLVCVLAGHRPSYVSSSDICPQCLEAFESTMNEFSVDLVLAGHVHAYERIAPIFQNVTDPNELNNPRFPWYIVTGAAGHYDGLDTLNSPLAPYSRAAFDTHYGWSRLTFHNCTHLTQDFVSSADGSILDTATLFKDRRCTN